MSCIILKCFLARYEIACNRVFFFFFFLACLSGVLSLSSGMTLSSFSLFYSNLWDLDKIISFLCELTFPELLERGVIQRPFQTL